jgi:MoxR-like ATPase
MTEMCPLSTENFRAKLRALRDALGEGLVEREVPIRLALLAALAGEHLLMVGPPGTAKSLVARRLHLALRDSTYFERLLTRFTVPEELFGPLSIDGLEHDRYERLTAGYLPKASIAFLDEIFKANSAILNALLTLLNEREFDNGARRERTPLVAVVGASNELPEGEELDALFDRFLLRVHVGQVSQSSFPTLLALRGQAAPDVPENLKLSSYELETVREASEAVEVPEEVVAVLCDLREWCFAENIVVSDRRWRKVVKLLQVSAVTNGRNRVSIWDCWLLQHCLWDAPEARENVYAAYAGLVGATAAMDPVRLTKIVVSWEARLKRDKEGRSQMRDKEGNLLYINPEGRTTTEPRGRGRASRNGEPLYLSPPHARSPSDRHSALPDRTNGQRGYTRAELEQLYIDSYHPFRNWSGCDRYLADQSNYFMNEGDMRLAMEPARYKAAYIQDCDRQIQEVCVEVERHLEDLDGQVRSLESEVQSHLWVTPDFAEPALENLMTTRGQVDALLSRLARVRAAFLNLPCDGVEPFADGSQAAVRSKLLATLNGHSDSSSSPGKR